MRDDAYRDTFRHDNDRYPSVLVVEDEPILRLDISLALSDAGFAVIETASGEEALEILRTRRGIGVVFTDVELPGISGIALGEAIARDYPEIAVLVTSGASGPKFDAMRALPTFFPKPYSPHAVIDRVRHIAA